METTKMLKCTVVNATIGYPLVNHTHTTLPAQFEQTEIDFASEHYFLLGGTGLFTPDGNFLMLVFCKYIR